jgi:hypothetical protein
MRISTLFASCALAGALTLGGCVGSGTGYVSATYRSPTPDLIYLGDGVYVVEGRPRPTFYSNGYYWLYDGGYWFRSTYYTGDWVRVRRAPAIVRHVRDPRVYVHYRADVRQPRYRAPRYNEEVRVRDHRRDPDRRRQDQRARRGTGRY